MMMDDFFEMLIEAGAVEGEELLDAFGILPDDVNVDEWGDPVIVGKSTLWEETVT